jgi:RimJ/RimL family protein N-acetyltransferase
MTHFEIRKATPNDADFVLALFARPHVREFAHGPQSVEAFRNVLLRGDAEVMIIERGGRPFGNVNFTVTDGWLMDVRVIAFEEPRTGAGLFTMKWLLRYGFEELGIHRVFLEVLERNTAAQALCERLGFCREGCYRDGYRAADGTYHNLIPYGLLAT